MAPCSDGFLSGFPGCLSPLPSPYLLGVLGRPRPQVWGTLLQPHKSEIQETLLCVCVCVSRWLAGAPQAGMGAVGRAKGAHAWFLSPTPILADPQLTPHSGGAQPGLADQAAKLSYASAESLETMSEAELP